MPRRARRGVKLTWAVRSALVYAPAIVPNHSRPHPPSSARHMQVALPMGVKEKVEKPIGIDGE